MNTWNGWPINGWTPDSTDPPPIDVNAGRAIPDVRRPCGRRGRFCTSVYQPDS